MFALQLVALVLSLSAAAFIATMLLLGVVSSFSSSKWFCATMGWHRQPDSIGFDGCSRLGCCPRCGKHVLLDSQGNWF